MQKILLLAIAGALLLGACDRATEPEIEATAY